MMVMVDVEVADERLRFVECVPGRAGRHCAPHQEPTRRLTHLFDDKGHQFAQRRPSTLSWNLPHTQPPPRNPGIML